MPAPGAPPKSPTPPVPLAPVAPPADPPPAFPPAPPPPAPAPAPAPRSCSGSAAAAPPPALRRRSRSGAPPPSRSGSAASRSGSAASRSGSAASAPAPPPPAPAPPPPRSGSAAAGSAATPTGSSAATAGSTAAGLTKLNRRGERHGNSSVRRSLKARICACRCAEDSDSNQERNSRDVLVQDIHRSERATRLRASCCMVDTKRRGVATTGSQMHCGSVIAVTSVGWRASRRAGVAARMDAEAVDLGLPLLLLDSAARRRRMPCLNGPFLRRHLCR